jgi:hypothetical protein
LTTVRLCARCGDEQQLHEDPAELCRPCTATFARQAKDTLAVILVLREAQARLRRVDPDITRGVVGVDEDARTLDGRFPQTAAATRSPAFMPAADQIRDLRRTVEKWAQHVAATVVPALCRHDSCQAGRRPWCLQALNRATAAAGIDRDAGEWLARHVDVVRHAPWAAACATDLDRAHTAAWRVVDRPPDVWFAGKCDATTTDNGTDGPCGHDLFARLDDGIVRCRACGTDHDVAARREIMLDTAGDAVLNASDCARALTSLEDEIRPELIWKWKQRGILTPVDTRMVGKREEPLYRLRDVRAALHRHTYGIVRTT